MIDENAKITYYPIGVAFLSGMIQLFMKYLGEQIQWTPGFLLLLASSGFIIKFTSIQVKENKMLFVSLMHKPIVLAILIMDKFMENDGTTAYDAVFGVIDTAVDMFIYKFFCSNGLKTIIY